MVPLHLLVDLGVCVSFLGIVEVVHVGLKFSDVFVEEFGHGVFDLAGLVDLLGEGVHLAGLDFDASA